MNPRELEKILKAAASRQRIAILAYLKKERTAPVSDIAKAIKLSFKSTSHHLRTLSAAGIVERDQVSNWGYYRLSAKQHSLIRNILSLL